jgi:hypothetical protein
MLSEARGRSSGGGAAPAGNRFLRNARHRGVLHDITWAPRKRGPFSLSAGWAPRPSRNREQRPHREFSKSGDFQRKSRHGPQRCPPAITFAGLECHDWDEDGPGLDGGDWGVCRDRDLLLGKSGLTLLPSGLAVPHKVVNTINGAANQGSPVFMLPTAGAGAPPRQNDGSKSR